MNQAGNKWANHTSIGRIYLKRVWEKYLSRSRVARNEENDALVFTRSRGTKPITSGTPHPLFPTMVMPWW
jgi:hypothetical protein